MTKECFVVMRSVGNNSYPIMAFLSKDEAKVYKTGQENTDIKARYFIDNVDLVGL